jgi:fermentation-respiration switch protein FrsA (DUF1100 family)
MLFSRYPWAPVELVRAFRTPVFVAVGGLDQLDPPAMGRAVFAAAACKGELLEVATAHHTNIPNRGGARYWRWLALAVLGRNSLHRAEPPAKRP